MAETLESALVIEEDLNPEQAEGEDNEEDEEDEEEEEEPNLKYSRFCSDLVKSLGPQGDSEHSSGPVELISCMAVHFKVRRPQYLYSVKSYSCLCPFHMLLVLIRGFHDHIIP